MWSDQILTSLSHAILVLSSCSSAAAVLLFSLALLQVRDDENWWNAPADAGSSDDQSEDPNAEDW